MKFADVIITCAACGSSNVYAPHLTDDSLHCRDCGVIFTETLEAFYNRTRRTNVGVKLSVDFRVSEITLKFDGFPISGIATARGEIAIPAEPGLVQKGSGIFHVSYIVPPEIIQPFFDYMKKVGLECLQEKEDMYDR